MMKRTKKITAIFVIVTLLSTLLTAMSAQAVFAAADVWDGTTKDTEWAGSGTQADPYLISSAAELAGLSYRVRTDGAAYYQKFIKLTTDIDLNNQNFKPIGYLYGSTDHQFCGTFDGAGHVIKNLNFLRGDFDVMQYGLFGATWSATIKNLGIENAKIIVDWSGAYSPAGAFVGAASQTTIDNCYVINSTIRTASINQSGQDNGGLVGRLTSGGSVTNCYARGTQIVAYNASGSLTGSAGSFIGKVDNSTVSNSYSSDFRELYGKVSAFIETKSGTSTVTNCYYVNGSVVDGSTERKTDSYATKLTETELKAYAETLGDAFTADTKNLNAGYPILKWQNVEAEEHIFDVWDGTTTDTDWEGTGARRDPYLISSAAELAGLSKSIADTKSGYNNKHFKLTTDIDLDLKPFTPIGDISVAIGGSNQFCGYFDGAGHIIKNVRFTTSNLEDHTVDAPNVGLFGATYKGKISNLGLDNISGAASPAVHAKVGALVAQAQGTVIENCYATNTKVINFGNSGTQSYGGGLIGSLSGGRVVNCYTRGVEILLTAGFNDGTGGLIGYVNSFEGRPAKIINSYSADFKEVYGAASTFIGAKDTDSNVTNCYYAIGSVAVDGDTAKKTDAYATKVTATELAGMAETLGDAFAEDIMGLSNNGYPVLVYTEPLDFSAVVKYEVLGEETSVYQEGATLKSITVTDPYNTGIDKLVAVAFYDNDKLVDVEIGTAADTTLAEVTYTFNYEIPSELTGGEMKIMVWKNGTIEPLCWPFSQCL